jgi:hypothetical protein
MKKRTIQLGYYSAFIAFISAVGYSMVQVMQVVHLLHFPLDAILIYSFSLGIAPPFLLAMLALHYSVPEEKRLWSHGALLFALLYVGYVSLNYVVQLATVIPASLQGRLSEIRVLDQTPHSLFWDIDALGYICMGIANLLAVPLFARKGQQRWVRGFFLANALMTPAIAFVYFYPYFSTTVLLIGVPWMITAPGSILMLALYFKRYQLPVKKQPMEEQHLARSNRAGAEKEPLLRDGKQAYHKLE